MTTESHLFLSDDWIAAARDLRTEFEGQIPEPPIGVKMNVVVTDIPHRDDTRLEGHIDSSSGQLTIEQGHIEDPELSITVDYDTAKAAFVDRNQEAVMQAFFGGKIFVEGDVSRLMVLQGQDLDDSAIEMYKRLSALTRT